ncbi:hypothetical protein PMAYCL1PPCAC_25793, partial [Pristionchus mayeri]
THLLRNEGRCLGECTTRARLSRRVKSKGEQLLCDSLSSAVLSNADHLYFQESVDFSRDELPFLNIELGKQPPDLMASRTTS